MKKTAFDAALRRPWALHPGKLEEVSAVLQAHAEGFRLEGCFENKAPGADYSVRDGVAVIPVYGLMDRRMNLFMQISGGVSTDLLRKAVAKAAADPSVRAILLDVDSPGGSVHGPLDVSNAVRDAAAAKPVVAFTGEAMLSGAYWACSAASRVVAMPTAQVGSIGVWTLHVDLSAADEMQGVKRTYLSSGRYKTIASDNKPLSEEGAAYLQAQSDYYYSLFIQGVAGNRGVTAQEVLERMADGRIFIGEQAREAGLVDHIGDLEFALALAGQLATDTEGRMSGTLAAGAENGGGQDLRSLTAEELQARRPDLVQMIQDQARAQGVKDGVAAERERVLGILEADGDRELTLAGIKDGTAVAEMGMRFFQAEKAKRDQGLEELKSSAPASPGHQEPDQGADSGLTADQILAGKARKLAEEKGISVDQAQRQVLANDPKLRESLRSSLIPA